MASNVEICNNALFMLGSTAILALTDDNERARLCNGRLIYNRDALLRSYPWNFAMKRAELAQSATTPTWEFDYQYALPTNPLCLKVLSMEEDYVYKIEGRYLVTDSATATILYTAQITDPNEMDVLFREALAARIASDICYPLTGNSTQQDLMLRLAEQKLRQAKSNDAQEGTPDSLIDDTFINARY
ncbi:MAG: hypothetical protein WC332_03315 [Clostridia bacterium]|jgi:hypothetical protein